MTAVSIACLMIPTKRFRTHHLGNCATMALTIRVPTVDHHEEQNLGQRIIAGGSLTCPSTSVVDT